MTATASSVPHSEGVFSGLKAQPADALLAVMNECRADPRPHKIDLTVGMYRDASGATPVMRAVKAAEKWMLENQATKGYLSPEGDMAFVSLLKPFVLPAGLVNDARVTGVQTPGGTGAIRLGGDLVAASGREPTVWLGLPTWGNYRPLLQASRLKVETYTSFDTATQQLHYHEVMRALKTARPGDVVVLQASCNNPTGVTFDAGQWAEIASVLKARQLLPLLDVAYQGLGQGMQQDVASVHTVLAQVDEALIAYSCDKNFGVYRERVGALYVVARSPAASATVHSNLVSLARANWSMPSDHGAAVVRHVLETPALTQMWQAELDEMRARVADNRRQLAATDPRFAFVGQQEGMFSMLHLEPAAIQKLKVEHGVYMASSGRINVAGFCGDDIPRFAKAVAAVVG